MNAAIYVVPSGTLAHSACSFKMAKHKTIQLIHIAGFIQLDDVFFAEWYTAKSEITKKT
jgi:hypothetical protein